ncbi:unnamed protein product [Oncorhynchus mykiss]|uniref:Vps8 RING finger domain-containing protein n=1 Tax=Oncorhynchus mykiss TaxID=8022 RepID=A0A060Z4H8_ONCMY|nr:unnamed protein product [Oncorhynchus mykiss]
MVSDLFTVQCSEPVTSLNISQAGAVVEALHTVMLLTPCVCVCVCCGHLYHCQCLQRKGSGHAEPRLLQVWSCYKCISSQRGRGGDRVTTETGRGRSTSLAQTNVMSREAGEDGKKVRTVVGNLS